MSFLAGKHGRPNFGHAIAVTRSLDVCISDRHACVPRLKHCAWHLWSSIKHMLPFEQWHFLPTCIYGIKFITGYISGRYNITPRGRITVQRWRFHVFFGPIRFSFGAKVYANKPKGALTFHWLEAFAKHSMSARSPRAQCICKEAYMPLDTYPTSCSSRIG